MQIPWKTVGLVAGVGIAGFIALPFVMRAMAGEPAQESESTGGGIPDGAASQQPTLFLPSGGATGGGGAVAPGTGFDAGALVAMLGQSISGGGGGDLGANEANVAMTHAAISGQVALAELYYNSPAGNPVYGYSADLLGIFAPNMKAGQKVDLNLGGYNSSMSLTGGTNPGRDFPRVQLGRTQRDQRIFCGR
jgi:hypothetical protein